MLLLRLFSASSVKKHQQQRAPSLCSITLDDIIHRELVIFFVCPESESVLVMPSSRSNPVRVAAAAVAASASKSGGRKSTASQKAVK